MPPDRRGARSGARRRTFGAACLLLPAVLVALAHVRAHSGPHGGGQAPGPSAPGEAQARAVCGTCHASPPPDILPAAAWRDEFVRMMFIRENRLPPVGPPGLVGRTVTLPPDMEQVLPFFTSRAPDRLPPPQAWPPPGSSPVRFSRHSLSVTDMPRSPAVSSVQLVDMDGDGALDVLGTDMRQGVVFAGRPVPDGTLRPAASLPHPARATPADVDGDGVLDLLVGDMGEFFPADHRRGAVIWLRGTGSGRFTAFWLDGWPRVAAVRAADFTGDGRKELAVAAFGWRTTGQVAILADRSGNPARPDFATHVIDSRPGAIDAVPVDLNRDGHMDLVTLLAQEHETVLAYVNRGTGDFSFEQKVIYAAPHPNWGSSGFQVVDMDGDGDLDVLLAHGDTFDDGIVKPYHGIQLLENRGEYPFTAHTLADMPGVHGLRAGDIDGDGDLDVVAAALLAGGANVDEKTLPAVAWLEQVKKNTFVRHTLELGFPRHATLDVGDIDADGDVDIVVGNFSIDKPAEWVDVWVNESRRTGQAPRGEK